jgi:hypothetical protein
MIKINMSVFIIERLIPFAIIFVTWDGWNFFVYPSPILIIFGRTVKNKKTIEFSIPRSESGSMKSNGATSPDLSCRTTFLLV